MHTVTSFCALAPTLIKESGRYLLSEVFCQDPIEHYFSKQRHRGGGNENPTNWKYPQNHECWAIIQIVTLRLNLYQAGLLSITRCMNNIIHNVMYTREIKIELRCFLCASAFQSLLCTTLKRLVECRITPFNKRMGSNSYPCLTY